MNQYSSYIAGIGSYLPKEKIDNHFFAQHVETSHDWIVERTGIHYRHIASEGETNSTLSTNAAKAAIENAGVDIDDIDGIIVGTSTPDYTFPGVGVMVQANIGMKKGFAFDVQAVCSGFMYALSVADNMIRGGQVKCLLVIGAETMFRALDLKDRSTCVLFGDGAGAVILKQQPAQDLDLKTGSGILSTTLHSDGRLRHILQSDGGVSSTKSLGNIVMNGQEVFRAAVSSLLSVTKSTMEKHQISADDIDWFVPHQANKRIIDYVAAKAGIPAEKTVVTVDQHANTSAASIPLALDHLYKSGKLKRGDLILMESVGGGFSWASSLLRW
jgi:3-oxoacyl-[acyl-carrier-protein] synthase-3